MYGQKSQAWQSLYSIVWVLSSHVKVQTRNLCPCFYGFWKEIQLKVFASPTKGSEENLTFAFFLWYSVWKSEFKSFNIPNINLSKCGQFLWKLKNVFNLECQEYQRPMKKNFYQMCGCCDYWKMLHDFTFQRMCDNRLPT